MKFELNPYHRDTPERELLDDLRRVAEKLSVNALTKSLYDAHGQFCSATFRKRFRTWNKALVAAGLVPAKLMNVSAQELIDDIKRVAVLTGTTRITKSQYKQHDSFSEAVVYRHFGSWRNALETLGLTPGWSAVTTEELFDNLENVWGRLGRQPTVDEMVAPLSRFNGKTYAARFGDYRKALEAFVAAIHGETHAPTVEFTPTVAETFDVNSGPQQRSSSSRAIGWRLRFLTLRRDGFRCRACGRSPATTAGVELVVDHIVAWSNGGKSVLENLQTLCVLCNGGKSNLNWSAG